MSVQGGNDTELVDPSASGEGKSDGDASVERGEAGNTSERGRKSEGGGGKGEEDVEGGEGEGMGKSSDGGKDEGDNEGDGKGINDEGGGRKSREDVSDVDMANEDEVKKASIASGVVTGEGSGAGGTDAGGGVADTGEQEGDAGGGVADTGEQEGDAGGGVADTGDADTGEEEGDVGADTGEQEGDADTGADTGEEGDAGGGVAEGVARASVTFGEDMSCRSGGSVPSEEPKGGSDVGEKTEDITSMPGYLPWEKDLEMISAYEEKKDSLSADYKKYIAENPEVWAILADFLQAILIQRPDNVYTFAREFFQPFDPLAPKQPSHPTTRL